MWNEVPMVYCALPSQNLSRGPEGNQPLKASICLAGLQSEIQTLDPPEYVVVMFTVTVLLSLQSIYSN